MTTRPQSRYPSAASLFLVTGAILLMAGNVAHPIDADPTPTSRFAFATEPTWIPVHLMLAAGFLLLAAGLTAFGRHLERGRGASWAHFGSTAALVGGTILVAVFAALDGYAVSALAEATPEESVQAAAMAEEAIDSGLAAVGTLTFFGLAVAAFGIAIVSSRTVSPWVGWAGVAIGLAGTLAGTALLTQGPTAFTINVMLRPAAIAGTLWFIVLGIASRHVDPARRMNSNASAPAGSMPA